MVEKKLKSAVLGLNQKGQLLAAALKESVFFDLKAVADSDLKVAEKTAKDYGCTPYDDYRQLIIQNELDCLLVAESMHNCRDFVRAAIKKKVNILKLSPAARNFEESAEFAKLANEERVKFVIGNLKRFSPSFIDFSNFLKEGQIEQFFLITAFCTAKAEDCPVWQTDPRLSGGGVLLCNSYEIIDQIIFNFDMPQEVYSLNINTANNRQQKSYLTEDAAVVTMKFADSVIANLAVSKTHEENEEIIKIYGTNGVLSVGEHNLAVTDGNDGITKKLEYNYNQIDCMKGMLENFALSILTPDKNKVSSSILENLKNMAVIECAYLSARTGMPEEPARILQMV